MLDRPYKEIYQLYKNVIDKVSDKIISYEAKFRFVGVAWLRNKSLKDKDNQYNSFLNIEKQDQNLITKDLKKLLWLVRLRTFIVTEDYEKGLIYLRGIPLLSMTKTSRRVFEGEASELIYGLILKRFHYNDYAQLVKEWEYYLKKYLNKVPALIEPPFIVCQSYLKLGLSQGFNRTLKYIKHVDKTKKRTFPRWIEGHYQEGNLKVISELEMLKLLNNQEYLEANNLNKKNISKYPKYIKYLFYQGVIDYRLKKYDNSINSFKNYLVQQDSSDKLNQNEIRELFEMYTDSLYKLQKFDEFLKISRATLEDLNKSKKLKEGSLILFVEKLSYQHIEILMNHSSYKAGAQVIPLINKHLTDFPESPYKYRLKYLLALAYIKDLDNTKAEKTLMALTNDDQVPTYLKDLAKTELSTMKLLSKKL